jgi:cytochrome c heme-lyase
MLDQCRCNYFSFPFFFSQLKRKNKAGDLEEDGLIDAAVVKSVAEAHAKVTKLAWDGVLEYENLHKASCSRPQLIRFSGNSEYTIKARLWQLLGCATFDTLIVTLFVIKSLTSPSWPSSYELPFDRHDWAVNRCGREITYIIDFYSVPGDEAAMVVVRVVVNAECCSVLSTF